METPQEVVTFIGNTYAESKEEYAGINRSRRVNFEDRLLNLALYLAKLDRIQMHEAGRRFLDRRTLEEAIARVHGFTKKEGENKDLRKLYETKDETAAEHAKKRLFDKYGLKVHKNRRGILTGFESDTEFTDENATPGNPFMEAYLPIDRKPRIRTDAFYFDLGIKLGFLERYGQKLPFDIGKRLAGADIESLARDLCLWHEEEHKRYGIDEILSFGIDKDLLVFHLWSSLFEELFVSYKTLLRASSSDQHLALLTMETLARSETENPHRVVYNHLILNENPLKKYREFLLGIQEKPLTNKRVRETSEKFINESDSGSYRWQA